MHASIAYRWCPLETIRRYASKYADLPCDRCIQYKHRQTQRSTNICSSVSRKKKKYSGRASLWSEPLAECEKICGSFLTLRDQTGPKQTNSMSGWLDYQAKDLSDVVANHCSSPRRMGSGTHNSAWVLALTGKFQKLTFLLHCSPDFAIRAFFKTVYTYCLFFFFFLCTLPFKTLRSLLDITLFSKGNSYEIYVKRKYCEGIRHEVPVRDIINDLIN